GRLHPGHPVPARPGHRHPGVLRHGARRPRRRRPPPARPVLLVAARRDPRGRAPRLRARHRPDPPRSGAGAAMSAERAPTLRQILGYPPLAETVSLTGEDRKSTRLNSSHVKISYAVFCLKKKKKNT